MIVTEEFKKGVFAFIYMYMSGHLIEAVKVPILWIVSSLGLRAGPNSLRSTTSTTSTDIICKLLHPQATLSSKSNGKWYLVVT